MSAVPFYRFLEVGVYYLLNLVPYLLLAVYPFRRHFRFPALITNLLIVAVIVARVILGFLGAFSPLNTEALAIISIVIHAGLYFLIIKDHFGRLCFMLLVFLNIGNLVRVCAKFLEGLLFGSMALESYRWSMLICMVIIHLLITTPVVFYVRKYFNSSVPIYTKSWNYIWIIPATFYAIWYYHMYFAGKPAVLMALDVHNTVFLLFVNLGAFVVYHTVILLLFEQQKTAQLVQKNYMLTLQTIQHENLQQRINQARQAKHDVHHHVHLIREYLKSGQLEKLENYLDQYTLSLPDNQSVVYCQNYAVNSLLGYFVNQATQHEITADVFVQFPENINLPETTLSVLLGNLLENAIAACDTVTSGEKKLTVRGKASHGFIYLDVSNNYSGSLKKSRHGEYVSTKIGGQGLGLGSVASLVSAHNGLLEVDDSDNIFRVSVMLQEQSENQQ